MPRTARRDAPNEIHHVWARGLERRDIFRDAADRADLVERLSRILPESGVTCLAWCLLPNHYHLVLKRREVSLSHVMARINTGYAIRFNRRHERAGFLFQNRFGSRIVDDDASLPATVRYVVLNPVKHGLCEDESALGTYLWGSISGLRGMRAAHPFECLDATARILGGRGTAPPRSVARPGPGPTTPPPHRSFDEWTSVICGWLGVEPSELGSAVRRREISDARAALCWVAVQILGWSCSDAAARLSLSRSATSRALRRGRRVWERIDANRRDDLV